MRTIKMENETKEIIIRNCEKYITVLEKISVDCYLILKTEWDGDIRYRGYIAYEDGYTSCTHIYETLDECLINLIACKYEENPSSHATPYIMKMIGM